MEKQTWHLLFYKRFFSVEQVKDFIMRFNEDGDFGGLPIQAVRFEADTSKMVFATLIFEESQPLDGPTIEQMAKFLYAKLLFPKSMSLPEYYGIIQQSSDALGISFNRYPNNSMDVIFWGSANALSN